MSGRFDWRHAYFNVISLVAVVVFLVAAIGGGHGLLRLFFPALSLDRQEWQQVQSFEAYKQWRGRNQPVGGGLVGAAADSTVLAHTVSENKLRQEWNEHRRVVVEGERRRGLWNILEALVTLIVVVPVYWWHRRGAKRLRISGESVE